MRLVQRPPKELQDIATRLKSELRAQGEGATRVFTHAGAHYLAKAEWHPPGVRNPVKHIGVTLYHYEVMTLPEVTIYGSVSSPEPGPLVNDSVVQRTLLAVPGLEERTTPELRDAFVLMCDRLGANADHMAVTFSFESGWNHQARNKKSGATGFIQFMPKGSAKDLGTTCEALAAMTPLEQLVFVERYFQPYKGKTLQTLEGCYLSVFYPRARGMAPAAVVARAGSKVYEQNAGFDRDRDGDVEVQEICAAIYAHAAKAKGRRTPV